MTTTRKKVAVGGLAAALVAGATILGVDISHYQAGAKVANYNFTIAKAAESTTYHDPSYNGFAAQAKKANKPFGAYDYVHGGSDAYVKAEAAFAVGIVGKSVPIAIDCEWASGCNGRTVHVWVAEVRRLGGKVTLIYMPKAYWQSAGSPNLGDIKGVALWNARYPGGASYPGDSSTAWNGYGGLPVKVWQYSDAGNLDRDAFKGTSTQLCSVLYCWHSSPVPTPKPSLTPAPKPKPKPSPTPTPTPSKPPVSHSRNVTAGAHRLIRLGSRGRAVTVAQRALGIKADGRFGPKTRAAVRAFQHQWHLTVDGIVGPKTWHALYLKGR